MTEIIVVNNLGDQRQRYRFVYEPLLDLKKRSGFNFEVNVFTQQAGIKGIFQVLREIICHINKKRSFIYCGVGFAGLIWVIACRITKNIIILRLGGEPSKNFLRLGFDNWHLGQYKTSFVLFFNYITSKIAIRFVHGIIVVNEILARRLREEGEIRADSPVFVVPQPLLLDNMIKAEKRQGNSTEHSDTVQILTITGFLFEGKLKPVMTLIDSFLHENWRNVARDLPNVIFSIIGGGKKLKELQEYVTIRKDQLKKAGVDVQIMGQVPGLGKWYNSADIFVYGSKLDGVPNVLLEAQFYGLPIVVNDLEEFQSLLKEDRNAWFYKTDDAAHASLVIGELLRTPEKMREIGNANREDVRVNFGLPAIAEKMRDVVLFCQTNTDNKALCI